MVHVSRPTLVLNNYLFFSLGFISSVLFIQGTTIFIITWESSQIGLLY